MLRLTTLSMANDLLFETMNDSKYDMGVWETEMLYDEEITEDSLLMNIKRMTKLLRKEQKIMDQKRVEYYRNHKAPLNPPMPRPGAQND